MKTAHDPLDVLFAEVAQSTGRLAPDPARVSIPNQPSADEVRRLWRKGTTAIEAAPPEVTGPKFAAVWHAMADIVVQQQPEGKDAVDRCRRTLDEAAEDDVAALASAFLRNDAGVIWDWAEARQLDPAWLYLIGEFAARPFLRSYAARITEGHSMKEWKERTCPVCGRRPNVGIIQGENFKALHCPGCSTRWPTRRYQCGLCGHAEEGALHFLVVDEFPGWRIETCNGCRGYLKVIDHREPGMWTPDQDLFVEDARTLALDTLAQQEGYRKPDAGGGDDDS